MNYDGSLGIDLDLMDLVELMPYERILVVNSTNGERLETYAIPAARGTRTICLNGAAARRGAVGDTITIMSFGLYKEQEAATVKPKMIRLGADNRVETAKVGG